jgi:hypothetical protein
MFIRSINNFIRKIKESITFHILKIKYPDDINYHPISLDEHFEFSYKYTAYSKCGIYKLYSNDNILYHSHYTSALYTEFKVYFANDIYIGIHRRLRKAMYSIDAMNWKDIEFPDSDGYYAVSSIEYADDKWIISIENRGVYYSYNGIIWFHTNIVDGVFPQLIYRNDIFVLGGLQNRGIYYSENGIEWTQSNIDDKSIREIVYSEKVNQFMVFDYKQNIYISFDGKVYCVNKSIHEGMLNNVVSANFTW